MFRKLLYSAFGVMGAREVRAFDEESKNAQESQLQRLLQIVAPNANTAYGRAHSFSAIKTISDFQRAVPINVYDSIQPYIERAANGEREVLTAEQPIMFATTSGTTGARKLIPITPSYVKEFRRASVVSGFTLLKNFPGISRGVTLSVFSPAEESRTAAGIPCGAISGRLYLEEPKLIKKFVSPLPYELFLIDDYESRYYSILRCALMLPISTIYTLNPSTIVLLGRRLSQYADRLIADIERGTFTPPGKVSPQIETALAAFMKADARRAQELRALQRLDNFTPEKVWNQLSLISCWTRAAAAFYLKDFPQYYGNVPVCDITYGASEGRGTVCVGRDKQALAIRSHFFEFVPEEEIDSANPRALIADELEVGKSYYILFTTSGGLFRYNINDIVKVVGWHNQIPLLEFQHKGGNISSFTGEKVTESQVTDAVRATMAATGCSVRFFTVVPQFRPEPHYDLWVEFESISGISSDPEVKLRDMAAQFDRQMGLKNIEYLAKRESQRLAPATARLLPGGTYDQLRRNLVAQGVPDAQIKVSHLNPKDEVKATLESALVAPV
ncbi:MAG TPA: GH3 auxin-responsive promoter family protein [Planktothrix sp.]|jgi:hypothetical protein